MFKRYFLKILRESGSNYISTTSNTAGTGGALGNSPNMYTSGTASGTTGTDTYAPGDYRVPKSLFGVIKRKNKKIKKKK